jgi:hypothetical protein
MPGVSTTYARRASGWGAKAFQHFEEWLGIAVYGANRESFEDARENALQTSRFSRT